MMNGEGNPKRLDLPFFVSVAGAGGQGIVSMSYFLAHLGMRMGLEVTWFPSYGAAMRGGTAKCSVVLSEEEVHSPIFSRSTHAIIFNNPSLVEFESRVRRNGALILNSDLVSEPPTRSDISVFRIPANRLAKEAGNGKAANMAMMGAFLELTGLAGLEEVEANIAEIFAGKYADLIPANLAATRCGAETMRAALAERSD